jgi:hypothetical protein
MDRQELSPHGHLAGCEFQCDPNRVIGDMKTACSEFNKTGARCRAHLSPQSCDLQLCARHWEWYCDTDKPGWCYHLSVCANIRADKLGLTQQERFRIIPSNIFKILELPSGRIHGHISETWRKQARESDGRGDFDLSDNDINSDDSDDGSDLDGFVVSDDSEIEYYGSDSDESDSDSRPKKRRRADDEIIDLTREVEPEPQTVIGRVTTRPIRRIIVESDDSGADE